MSLFLFDLDGTLIEGYMDRPDKAYEPVVPLPGRVEKVRQLQMAGHTVCVVTNQGGVALGHVTEDQADEKLAAVERLFRVSPPRSAGGQPKRWIYACYSHAFGKPPWNNPVDVSRRKPSPTMLIEAMRDHGFAPSDTVFVGDRSEDREAAHFAGVRYIGPDTWDEWWTLPVFPGRPKVRPLTVADRVPRPGDVVRHPAIGKKKEIVCTGGPLRLIMEGPDVIDGRDDTPQWREFAAHEILYVSRADGGPLIVEDMP